MLKASPYFVRLKSTNMRSIIVERMEVGLIYGGIRWERHRVRVVAIHELDGGTVPLAIVWDDGRRFDVVGTGPPRRKRCENAGGHALAYPIAVGGRARTLWFDGAVWFVEVPEGGRLPSDPRKWDIPC